VLTESLWLSMCSGKLCISDDKENKEVGERDGNVSSALGEQQQGIAVDG